MVRPHSSRPGVILVIVLLLLTLFAVVALSFVLYARAALTASELARDAQEVSANELRPELLFNHFLGQLLYDARDDATGVYSALRGHSLARSLFGYDGGPGGTASTNDRPFSGTGRLHGPSPFATLNLPGTPAQAADDYYLVNYTYFRDDPALPPSARFVRDPERLGARAGLAAAPGPFTGGFNVPYTYPDLNNLFLAAVRADGMVLTPSFHRPWGGFGGLEPGNPNWYDRAKPWLKYLVLRPRPADMGPGFPAPEDAGGDVKNLAGGPGGNDSIWLDLDFPVLADAAGRRYKPLFAPLIVDLDGRINVNIHGNRRSLGHVSDQGWGPWEVNPGAVLTQSAGPRPEWFNLLVGRSAPALPGRYGPDGTPGPAPDGTLAGFFTTPRFLGQVDFDGDAGSPVRVPGQAGVAPQAGFPFYPAGYDNGGAGERLHHPLLSNLFLPGRDDLFFPAAEMEPLLRGGEVGAEHLRSFLLPLLPANLRNPADRAGSFRRRRLLTTHSFDLNQPGLAPWLYGGAGGVVPGTDPTAAPRGGPVGFPPLTYRLTPPAGFLAPSPAGEFAADWRANSAGSSAWHGGGGRINLRRPLPPYPHQGGGPDGRPLVGPNDRFDGNDPAVVGQYTDALRARQGLADEIYRRLLAVTGVPPAANPALPTDAELQPRRWLAQLAVNIVDYLDEDDLSTPFNFYDAYRDAGGDPAFVPDAVSQPDQDLDAHEYQYPRYWVFGVELPRVVLNEVLVMAHDTRPAPLPRQETVRVFAELHNPFPDTVPASTQPADAQPVPLCVAELPAGTHSASGRGPDADRAYAPYRVVIGYQTSSGSFNENVLGNPVAVRSATDDRSFPAGSPSVAPQGYVTLGPTPDTTPDDALHFQARDPLGPGSGTMVRSPGLAYVHAFDNADELADGAAVLLRRLANPHLPFNPDRSAGVWYNPYITVDYLEKVPVRETRDPSAMLASRGKQQPYASDVTQVADEQATPTAGKVVHTFGQHNAPAAATYDWLVHLDRPPVSPPELLHVAGCSPDQLTHRFIQNGVKHAHRAPWFDQATRLYRLFEFLEAHQPGEPVLDVAPFRRPGRINLNTIWDPEVFLALCDPSPANNFTAADVAAVYQQLVAGRTPGLLQGGGPGPDDRPFRSLAAGVVAAGDVQYPRGSGIEDTLFRSFGGGDRRLFELAAAPDTPEGHPYLRYQLLSKIFNQVSVRSNVFAVWLTVGFFEVTDETTRPVKLGRELGRAEGRAVRRQFFAVVDRSVLTCNPGPQDGADLLADGELVPYVSLVR